MKVTHKIEVERKVLLKIYIEGDEAAQLCQFLREAYTLNSRTARYKPVADQFINQVEEQLVTSEHVSSKQVEDGPEISDV